MTIGEKLKEEERKENKGNQKEKINLVPVPERRKSIKTKIRKRNEEDLNLDNHEGQVRKIKMRRNDQN